MLCIMKYCGKYFLCVLRHLFGGKNKYMITWKGLQLMSFTKNVCQISQLLNFWNVVLPRKRTAWLSMTKIIHELYSSKHPTPAKVNNMNTGILPALNYLKWGTSLWVSQYLGSDIFTSLLYLRTNSSSAFSEK